MYANTANTQAEIIMQISGEDFNKCASKRRWFK